MSSNGPVAVARMFPDAAVIEVNTPTEDSEGTVEDHWAAVAEGVPAQLSGGTGGRVDTTELRTDGGSFQVRTLQLILYGWYDLADEAARITLATGRVFDVRGIQPDSWGVALGARGWTVLEVEERQDVTSGVVNASVVVGFDTGAVVFA